MTPAGIARLFQAIRTLWPHAAMTEMTPDIWALALTEVDDRDGLDAVLAHSRTPERGRWPVCVADIVAFVGQREAARQSERRQALAERRAEHRRRHPCDCEHGWRWAPDGYSVTRCDNGCPVPVANPALLGPPVRPERPTAGLALLADAIAIPRMSEGERSEAGAS